MLNSGLKASGGTSVDGLISRVFVGLDSSLGDSVVYGCVAGKSSGRAVDVGGLSGMRIGVFVMDLFVVVAEDFGVEETHGAFDEVKCSFPTFVAAICDPVPSAVVTVTLACLLHSLRYFNRGFNSGSQARRRGHGVVG